MKKEQQGDIEYKIFGIQREVGEETSRLIYQSIYY